VSEGPEVEALERIVIEQAVAAAALLAPGHQADFNSILSAQRSHRAYFFANYLHLSSDQQQQLLEAAGEQEVLELLHGFLTHEVAVLEVHRRIAAQSHEDMSHIDKQQILRQQLAAIRRELGEDHDSPEVAVLRQRMEKTTLPELVQAEADRQLQHLEGVPTIAAE